MNYQESKKILAEIKKADKILLNCHARPDVDSVGSALSLYQVIKKMGKKVVVVCPNNILEKFSFLPNAKKVKQINYKDFDFSEFDLFLCVDSSEWSMVVGRSIFKKVPIPKMPIINIDHHRTNTGFGTLNLVDENISSASELIHSLFEDWRVKVDRDIAMTLLAGIIGDTGAFRYPGATGHTLNIAAKLMDKGADKNELIHHLYRSIDFNLLKFWGEVLKKISIDKKYRFVWSAIPYSIFIEYGGPKDGKETAASLFTQTIAETDFGMVMVEEQKRNLSVSLRSRTGFDVSKIASEIGGGGHIYSAAGKIEGMEFDEAVEKVLATARKFAKKK